MPLIYLLAGMGIVILLHWAGQFIFKGFGPLMRFLIAFLLAGTLLFFLTFTKGWPLDESLAMAIWFIFLCELYVFLFTLSLGSVSIKMLHLLYAKPLSEKEIQEIYNPSYMVNIRFDRLEAAGLIDRTGHKLLLTKKGETLIRMFTLARRILHSQSADPRRV